MNGTYGERDLGDNLVYNYPRQIDRDKFDESSFSMAALPLNLQHLCQHKMRLCSYSILESPFVPVSDCARIAYRIIFKPTLYT